MGHRVSVASHVPVTIVGGFLGAGKTTLINRLIAGEHGRRLGVLVNDFGDIDIDGRLIVGVEDGVMKLANGCMCCTIKNDVVQAILQLIERDDAPEHLVVETSGVSDPGTIRETFLELQRPGTLRLDALVTVVDAEQFTPLALPDRLLARCQVLAADLVLLSKTDLVDETRVAEVTSDIREHHPTARVLATSEASFDLIVGSDPVERPPAEAGPHQHFSTWSFSTDAPFSFRELAATLNALPAGIFRAKGIVRLVERPGDRLVIHVVGSRVHVRTLDAGSEELRSDIVVIGADDAIDAASLQHSFAACVASVDGSTGTNVPQERTWTRG